MSRFTPSANDVRARRAANGKGMMECKRDLMDEAALVCIQEIRFGGTDREAIADVLEYLLTGRRL